MSTSDFSDSVNNQIDKRKIQRLVDNGVIDPEELHNAPILSISECCGADMLAEPDDPADKLPTCEKCGNPCKGAEA